MLSVHLGGAATRIGAEMWRGLADDPNEVFWDKPKHCEQPHPLAMFAATDCAPLDHLLSSRSAARGLFDHDQVVLLREDDFQTDSQRAWGSGVRCNIGRNQPKLTECLRTLMETMGSCQGAVLYHSLTGGSSVSLGEWFSFTLADMDLPSLAFQLCDDACETSLNGNPNALNELAALHRCQFTTRVLVSNRAIHQHSKFTEGPSFDGSNRMLAKALSFATATLRPTQDPKGLQDLNSVRSLRGLCGQLIPKDHPQLNLATLALSECGMSKTWTEQAVFDKCCRLGPFASSARNGMRFAGLTLVAGGAEVPAKALRPYQNAEPPSGTPAEFQALFEDQDNERRFLAGDVSCTCRAVSKPAVCALYSSPTAGRWLQAKLRRSAALTRTGAYCALSAEAMEAREAVGGMAAQYSQFAVASPSK